MKNILIEKLKGATTDSDCRKLLEQIRWSEGFTCPRCRNTKGYYLEKRASYECSKCKLQTSATSRTAFHGTRKLKAWFEAISSIISGENNTAKSFSETNRIPYATAWSMLQKVRYLVNKEVDHNFKKEISCLYLRKALFKSSSESRLEMYQEIAQEESLENELFAEQFVDYLLKIFFGISRKYVQLYIQEFFFSQGLISVDKAEVFEHFVRGSPIAEDMIKLYISPYMVKYKQVSGS